MIRTSSACARAEAARLADPPQLSVIERHAKSCPSCRQWRGEIETLRSVIDASARGPDDITRAHIQTQLAAAIAALEPAPRRWRWAMLGGALALGAAAAVLLALVVLPRAADPPARTAAVVKSPRPLEPLEHSVISMVPHLAAGPVAMNEAVRDALGKAARKLVVPHAGMLRAALSPVGRLTLIGPGAVSFAKVAPGEIGLKLDGGLLLLSINPQRRHRVRVRAGELTVTVKGTVFAVDARGSRPRVSVIRGVVAASVPTGPPHLVRHHQSWQIGAARTSPIDDETARLLDEHEASPAYSADYSGLLFLEGAPAEGKARLGDAPLGPTPVAARLPRAPAALTLEAAGHATTRVTVDIRGDRPTRVGYRLSATDAGSSKAKRAVASGRPEPSAADRYARAEAAMAAGDKQRARRILATLVTKHPRTSLASTALLELARLSRDLGDPDAAREHLRRLLQRRRVGRALRDSAHLLLCRCEIEARRMLAARRCLLRHRADHPGSPRGSEALSLLAQLTLAADGCAAALPLLREHGQRFAASASAALVTKLRRRCAGK